MFDFYYKWFDFLVEFFIELKEQDFAVKTIFICSRKFTRITQKVLIRLDNISEENKSSTKIYTLVK